MTSEAAERLKKWCYSRHADSCGDGEVPQLSQDDLREAMAVALDEVQKRHMRSVDIRALIAALKEKP